MTPLAAVAAPYGLDTGPLAMTLGSPIRPMPSAAPASAGFADVLNAGLRHVEGKLATADAIVRRFALDDDVPVHQVSVALEEARLSVELAMQVRARLVEAYRDVMAMQL